MFGVNPFKVDEEVKINAENYCKIFEKKKKNFFSSDRVYRASNERVYLCKVILFHIL